MEDRYLYKAKTKCIVDTYNFGKEDGEWVKGYLYCDTGKWVIKQFETDRADYIDYEVDPSTICQCTGLKDKNGKLIWENDIVSFEDTGEEGYEYKEGFDFTNRAKVEFAEGRWSLTEFASDNSGVMAEMYDHDEFMELWKDCEVIGNIFDNPELLGVEE